MNELAEKVEVTEVESSTPESTPLPKSKYNGVSFARRVGKWACKVLLNEDENGKRKLKHVGYFDNDYDAAVARNQYIDEHNLKCRKTKLEEV